MKGLQRYMEYEYIDSAIEPYRAAESTSVNICQSTCRDISEDLNLLRYRCQNLKSRHLDYFSWDCDSVRNILRSSIGAQYSIKSCRPLGAVTVTLLFMHHHVYVPEIALFNT